MAISEPTVCRFSEFAGFWIMMTMREIKSDKRVYITKKKKSNDKMAY